jgi:hypothetical protein
LTDFIALSLEFAQYLFSENPLEKNGQTFEKPEKNSKSLVAHYSLSQLFTHHA